MKKKEDKKIDKVKNLYKNYEYNIVSILLFTIHIKIFLNNVSFKKWKWDLYHIYFCIFTAGLIILMIYATIIYFSLKKLDLKHFPIESIASCKNYSNKKNKHPYVSFERNDLIHMKYIKLLYGSIFMAMWKLLLLFIVSIVNLSVCVFLSLFIGDYDKEEDVNSIILRFYLKFLKIICRITLWIFGINKIENHYLCDDVWPKNIVSNHISGVDPFYFISDHSCSFVSKKCLRKDKFIGTSIMALKCVLVNRDNLEDRKKALESIKERQLLINDRKKNYPSFVIFSEGTTSNGMQLIEQKKGAFFSLLPITPVLLIYDYKHFNPSYDILPFTWWVFLSAANYESITLRTYWLPKVFPPEGPEYSKLTQEEKINIFHDKVSKIMFKNMKKYNPEAPQDVDDYNDWPGSLRLKLEYFETALGKVATKQLKKEKELSEK